MDWQKQISELVKGSEICGNKTGSVFIEELLSMDGVLQAACCLKLNCKLGKAETAES